MPLIDEYEVAAERGVSAVTRIKLRRARTSGGSHMATGAIFIA